MKKIVFFAFLLAICVPAGRAQESRQDISISGNELIEPFVGSSTDVYVHSTPAYGVLASYRFMITPANAFEANYGITYQNKINYTTNTVCGIENTPSGCDILTRNQEISGAFVHTFNFRKFNPFVEAGGGVLIFMPIQNMGTKLLGAKMQKEPGFLYGGGIAYEISPSFDIRYEYRSFVTKVPNFGFNGGGANANFSTNKWYNIYSPVVLGVAYHF